MLNQDLYSHLRASGRLAPRDVPPINPDLANSDWRVGDAPGRWDVSFTDKLLITFRRLFSRRQAATPTVVKSTQISQRQAA